MNFKDAIRDVNRKSMSMNSEEYKETDEDVNALDLDNDKEIELHDSS